MSGYTTAELEFSFVCPVKNQCNASSPVRRYRTRDQAWNWLRDHLRNEHPELVLHTIVREQEVAPA